LYEVVCQRRDNPDPESYVSSLFERGSDRILQKVGEETCEVVIAAKNFNSRELVNELADLVFHLLVLMADREISPVAVRTELACRFGISGLVEKAARGNSSQLRQKDGE
jgi:phosphoribosyl-ATP pyrophosphohydrolase